MNRDELIKKNLNYVQIPMPDFNKMTNEQLVERLHILSTMFQGSFKEDKS